MEQYSESYESYLAMLCTGSFPQISEFTSKTPVSLDSSEHLILTLPKIILSEPRAVNIGRSHCFNTRVAKGLYYRTGTYTSRSHEELMPLDIGSLTITSSRVIFLGEKRTIIIRLPHVLAVTPYKDGISIAVDKSSKLHYFTGLQAYHLTLALKENVDVRTITGEHLYLLLEALRGNKPIPPLTDTTLPSVYKKNRSSMITVLVVLLFFLLAVLSFFIANQLVH